MRVKRMTEQIHRFICRFSVCFSVAGVQGAEQNKDGERYAESEEILLAEKIIIPAVDDIRANGYPKNEKGETYGPDVWESMEEPDLLLTCNEIGEKGYIRQADFDDGVTTLEAAINHRPRLLSIFLGIPWQIPKSFEKSQGFSGLFFHCDQPIPRDFRLARSFLAPPATHVV